MTELNRFVEHLRNELTQYGEMLALLDQQQEAVVRCHPSQVLETASAITVQGEVIQTVRKERQSSQVVLAAETQAREAQNLDHLIGQLSPEYQLLVGALVQENNQLLQRIQNRMHQNHLLLSRSLESMQQVISTLCQTSPTTTYGETGRLRQTTPGRLLCEAVG
jgi:flagellar biosynthesis/type III secretory pathway chaperone